jgi:dGTP triphosphohydrolase
MSEEKQKLEEMANRPADKQVGDSTTAPEYVSATSEQDKEPSGDNKRLADKDQGDKQPESVSTEAPQAGVEGVMHDGEQEDMAGHDTTGIDITKDDVSGMMKTESAVEVARAKLQESIEFKIDIKEDLGSLFESAELDEEFVQKATLVFESAITEVAQKHIEQIQEAAEEFYQAAVNEEVEKVQESVDKYTTYAVNEWMEENKIAIETGIMVEQAKSLFAGLQDLMAEHNLELSDSDVLSIEESQSRVAQVEESLSAEIDKNIELTESIKSLKKELVVEQFVSGLVDTQAEKVRGLAEELDFDDAESFREKLGVLKENYFPAEGASQGADLMVEDASGDVIVEEETLSEDANVPDYVKAAAEFMSRHKR